MKKIFIFVSLLFFACQSDPTSPIDFVSEKAGNVVEFVSNLIVVPITNNITNTVYITVTNTRTHIISNSVDKSAFVFISLITKNGWYSNEYLVSKSSLYNTNLSYFRVEVYSTIYGGCNQVLVNPDKVKIYQGKVTVYDPTYIYTNAPYNYMKINIFWKEWTFHYSNY